jgi:hypothetical protein
LTGFDSESKIKGTPAVILKLSNVFVEGMIWFVPRETYNPFASCSVNESSLLGYTLGLYIFEFDVLGGYALILKK